MKAAAFSLVALTLNVAGPRRVHQGWPTRREALVAGLAAEKPDAAAFQDVWRAEDVAALAAAAGHEHRAEDERLGLAVTSRYEIESTTSAVLGQEAGALRARLKVGSAEFDVYSVRLERGEGRAAAWRLAQLFELAEFVRAQSAGRPFLLLGDLGAPADEKDATVFLDLIEGRDLCVSHGDEVCGRTRGDRREDFAVIPYAARAPRENARTVLNQPAFGDDEETLPPRFGLRAVLDASFLRLKPAAQPPGRDEALATVFDALERERAETAHDAPYVGWIPFLGARDALNVRDEIRRLDFALEEVRSAQIRAARAEAAP